MQHILRAQIHPLSAAGGIGIGQRTHIVSVYFHTIRQQRIKSESLAPTAADDLTVGVAPQQQMRKQRFPQHKGGHLAVGVRHAEPDTCG